MILRDPVHGLLAFESEESRCVPRLLQTEPVQRLRRIRQLGVTSLAFPGAEHTRFAHALGTAHVMQRLLARLRDLHDELPYWQRVTSERAEDALSAALLHDVGHGPLSHLFESALPELPHHEHWSTEILLDPAGQVFQALSRADAGRPMRVAELVHGRGELPYLARAVSGVLDVDRCDYLLRDAHATGVRYGAFDLDWLLQSLRFGRGDDAVAPPLAVDGAKGLVAIEEFLLARFFMFQQVYFHKSTRAAERMIKSALALGVACLADGVALADAPRALVVAARGDRPSLGEYLDLDDAVVWQALHAWERAPHPVLADLCRRIRSRSLWKTIELFGEDATRPERALDVARDVARAAGLDPAVYVQLDVAEDTPFCEDDAAPVVVSPHGPPRRLSEVSFLLGRLAGETLSKTRIVLAPELREPTRRALSA